MERAGGVRLGTRGRRILGRVPFFQLMLALAVGLLVGDGTASVLLGLVGGAGSAVMLIALGWAGRILVPDLSMREERRAAYAPTRSQQASGVRWVVHAEHFRQPLIEGAAVGHLLVSESSVEFAPGAVQRRFVSHVIPWRASLRSVQVIDVWVAPRSYDAPRRRLRIVTHDGHQELFGVEGGADRAAASLNALLGGPTALGGPEH